MSARVAIPARDGALRLLVCAALAVWAWHAIPVLLGQKVHYYRDLAHNHYSMRWAGAQALAKGEIPAFVEQLGNGLPYRGNPAAVPFYPGNLLYLLLPFWSAFGGHLVLHWLLAGLTMYWLGRTLGMSKWAAATAGITYAGGGWFASTMTFYNIVAVVAWWPAVIAAGVLGGRLGVAAGGLACGLALLGGEPLTALLGLPPLVLAVVGRHGLRKGLGLCVAIGSIGCLLALPQIVATARIVEYSERGFAGTGAAAADYAFQWSRLLEMLLPFPFGHPGYLGARGWWLLGRLPFYFCLYSGVVGLALALLSLRRKDHATTSRPWAMLGTLGLLLAWAGGVQGDLVAGLSAGLFRYPEKFLLWFALGVPILVGLGLDELRNRALAASVAGTARPQYRLSLAFALLLVAAAPLVLAAAPVVFDFLNADGVRGLTFNAGLALEVQAQMLSVQLAMAGVVLVVFALLAARGGWRGVAFLQIFCLLPIGSLVLTIPGSAYRETDSWFADLTTGSGIVDTRALRPPWGFGRFLTTNQAFGTLYEIEARISSAATTLPHGLRLPFKGDSEGLGPAPYTLLRGASARMPWAERANWLAVLGTDALISVEGARVPALELVERRLFAGLPLNRLRVKHPLPLAFSPDQVVSNSSPIETLKIVGRLEDPRRTVVTDRPIGEHRPASRVSVLEAGNDRVVLEVEGPGGLVVVRRLYHPLWRASAEGVALRTTVAQLILIGVEVPAGRHRVVLAVPAGPEMIAGALALGVALACLLAVWRFRREAHLSRCGPQAAAPCAVGESESGP